MGAGAFALSAQPRSTDLAVVNGKIHTMDPANRVVSQALIRNGRFAAVGNNVSVPRGIQRIDLKGKTAIPGIVDAHNHIVLVGNRPGWHTPLEHVFTIPDAIAALNARSAGVPPGEYGVLAWKDGPAKAYVDPVFLKAVENQVTKVMVQRGFTNTINVRAIAP